MSPSVLLLPSVLPLLLAACVGTTAPPALVLQLTQVTHERTTERSFEERRELTFSAALSVGLETVAMLPIEPQSLDPPLFATEGQSCEPIQSALCAWIRAAEESAWLATLEIEEPSR